MEWVDINVGKEIHQLSLVSSEFTNVHKIFFITHDFSLFTLCLLFIQTVNISSVPASSKKSTKCVLYGGQYCWMRAGLSGSEFDSAGACVLREER